MAKQTQTGENKKQNRAPARTPEARQQQLIALAYDEAEAQIRNHKASSQVITHFLKLGTIKEQKELVLLEHQVELMKAKTEAIQSQKRIEELYSNALSAMRSYHGTKEEAVYED